MEVYWEYAFAENFTLDLLLLYLCLKCARGRIRLWRLLLSAAVGAGEAIVFPLLPLSVWAAYVVKLLGGIVLVLLAVSKGTKKTYLVAICAFFGLTFALGGLLVAVYSFFGVEYSAQSGYLVEKAPIGLIIGGAGLFAVAVLASVKGFYRYRKVKSALREVKLFSGGRELTLTGFLDSGNCLSFRGEPVSVLSPAAALVLFHEEPVGRIRIGTVNGGREAPVFACASMEIGGKQFPHALFTIGETGSKEYQIILHTSFVEGEHEAIRAASGMVTQDKG